MAAIKLRVPEVSKDSESDWNFRKTQFNGGCANVKSTDEKKNGFPVISLKNSLERLLMHYFLLKNAQK